MTQPDKIGFYGKGGGDVAKARADARKAGENTEKKFSKVKAYNGTVQPQPKN